MKLKLTLFIISISYLITSCQTKLDYEYAKVMEGCYSVAGQIPPGLKQYYELKKQLDCNLVGVQFPNYSFTDRNGFIVTLDKIDKPIFLKVLSRYNGNSIATVPAIKELAKKYKNEIVFILIVDDEEEDLAKRYSPKRRKQIIERWSFEDGIHLINAKEIDKIKYGNGEIVLNVLSPSIAPTTYILDRNKKVFYAETMETRGLDISKLNIQPSLNNDSILYERVMEVVPEKIERVINFNSKFYSSSLIEKPKSKIRSLVSEFFSGKISLIPSYYSGSNNIHNNIEMFNENGVDFIPVFKSKEEINSSKLYSYNSLNFDGLLFASQMDDNVMYKLNYSLEQEIVLRGKDIKEILKKDIIKFKEANQELFNSIE